MNIEVKCGDTAEINIDFDDIDVGSVIRFTVRENMPSVDVISDDDAVIAVMKTVSDITDTSIILSPSLTTIAAKKYFYDVQISTSSGTVASSETMYFNVLPDITRAE